MCRLARPVLFVLAVAAAPAAADEVVLSNAALELRLDPATGAVRQVTDRAHGLALVAQPGLAPAWRAMTSAGTLAAAGNVALAPDLTFDGTAYDLAWATSDARLTVHGRVELAPGSAPARFTARIDSAAGPRVDWLEYPVVSGIGALGADPAASEAIVPFATGYRLSDPLHHLAAGDRFGAYPDGYGGAPLQLVAYLEHGVGGFVAMVEDATGEAKRLDLWRDGATGWLDLSIRRLSADARAGLPLVPHGAVALAASGDGTWYDAADRYRDWALAQPWAADGPRRDWPAARRAPWLLEQTGVATFGISVTLDQTAWYTGLQNLLGVPLLHVSGFWWPGGTFASEWYGGYNDWSDDRVNAANIAAIHNAGDRLALFLFPYNFAVGANEYSNAAPDPQSDPVAPWAPYAQSPQPMTSDPSWDYMCPATAQWRDFFAWRNVQLMTHHLPDADYFDTGAGLGWTTCTATTHGHAPGFGRPLVEGTNALLDARRDELHALRGAFVPRGTEMIAEPYLARFDYYQARAAAGPLTMLEGDKFRGAVKAGWAEKIPLFDYVYHAVGPVRLDGNLKLATNLGTLFYHVAARVVLDGGIPELNYELSSLERLPGMTGSTWFETYRAAWDCNDLTPYAADPVRASFLRDLADLRTRRGRDWLAYGTMRRPPRLASAPAKVTLGYRLYNTFNRAFTCDNGYEEGPEYYETGSLAVDSIATSGWSAPAAAPAGASPRRPPQSVALGFVETGNATRATSVVLDPAEQGAPMLNFRVVVARRAADDDRGVMQAGATIPLTLAAHEAVLVKLTPEACTGAACRYRVYRAPAPQLLGDDASFVADVTGTTWSDASGDTATFFYLVDDGSGFPADTLRLARRGTAVDLAW